MHNYIRQGSKALFFTCFYMFVVSIPITTEASLINDVSINELDDGYEVTMHSVFPISYQSHSPGKFSSFLQIETKLINFNRLDEQVIDSLRGNRVLSLDRSTGIPLKDITYEGGDPEHPQIMFAFTKAVEYEVRGSSDLSSLTVTIKSKMLSIPEEVKESFPGDNKESVIEELVKEEPGEEKIRKREVRQVSTEKSVVEEKKLEKLMESAKAALTDGNYKRAIQIYIKTLRTAEGDIRKQAQEFLGFARERNDQFAHAKSEYKKYIKEYPEGSDTVRVRQRLAGLVTAAEKPKRRTVGVKRRKKMVKKPKRRIRNYGSYSNFFYRNQTKQEGRKTRVSRNDLLSNYDLNSRWISEDYDIRYKYTARHQKPFLSDKESQVRLSGLSFQVRHKESNLYGKIGRQSRSSGGVLGRFDGIHISCDISPKVVLNGVFGFPVQSTKNISVETDKKFYGVSADLGTFNERWDYTAFFITQNNRGITDRCAIGGEVRYFDPKKSFFALIDYDVFFNAMNIFLFNGRWTLPSKTTLNLMCDYRRSPLLMTNNAIQGQGVSVLDDLFGRYSDDELKELAVDRSAVSKSLTFGVTQQISDDIQLTGDFTVSRLEGTVASGGMDAMPGAGNEYYSSIQLNINNVFFKNDSIINGLRFSDTSRRNTYTYNVRTRIPFNKKIRLVPKFRMDYRVEKANDDNRLTMCPKLRIDYRLKKTVRFEIEGGVKWTDNYSSGISSKTKDTFVSVGYRISY